jgi:phosphatidylinositol alpha-1,6-mannosyltransferase
MSRPRHMLALVTDAFGGRGGIAQYNRDLFEALSASGLVSSISVLPRTAPDPYVLPPLRTPVRQAIPHRGRAAYSGAAIHACMRRSVDIVFCGHLYMSPIALLIARLRQAKLVVQAHGIEAWRAPARVQRRSAESADLILCVSRHTRSAILSWASISPERVLVLPNTVADAFTPGPSDHVRCAWGLGDKRVLLTVGRLDSRERYKGHDRVIAALPRLIAAGHDVAYLIAGEGDDHLRLRSLAEEAGVGGRVRFLGSIAREELVAAYRLADLFVMPSTGEGFGIAYLEAMACGTPALGLDCGGARDALADGSLGTLVPEHALVEGLLACLARPKPDSAVLASRVRARFGRQAFASRVTAALARLQEAAV